jgi:murein DD-endopeptidase MepM/ murein hydrolase activator NlpD
MLGRAVLLASTVAVLLVGSPTNVLADEVDDARARLNIINHLKGSLSDNLQRAEAQEIAMQQQLQETQDQINTTLQQIAETERLIADLESQITALQAYIAATRLELARAKADYGQFMRVTYKSQADPLPMLLGAPNFQAFLSRATTIERVNFLSKQLMDRITRTERELKVEEAVAKDKKAEADARRADLVIQKQALLDQQVKEKNLQLRLQASIRQVKWELVAINGQSAELAQRIADMEIARQDQLIAEAEQAAWQQAQFWMAHNMLSLPNQSATHSTKYPLIWPQQQGSISLPFGPCSYPFEPPGFGYRHFHTGIDIAFTQGVPILAADDGTVVAADASVLFGQLVGYGKYVIIAHRNNFFSLYGHLLGYKVKAGDTVRQGDVIGFEGTTGNSTGPHLHFEYRYNGQPTNPLPYLPANGPNAFNQ